MKGQPLAVFVTRDANRMPFFEKDEHLRLYPASVWNSFTEEEREFLIQKHGAQNVPIGGIK